MNDKEKALAELHQERMCDLCERHILGCSSNSSTYQCEGSRCDQALDYLIEDLENEAEELKQERNSKYKLLLLS